MRVGNNDSVSKNSYINPNINTTPLQETQNLRGHQVTISSITITQTTKISEQTPKMTVEGLDQHQDRKCEFSATKPNAPEVNKVKSTLTYPDSSQNYNTSGKVTHSSFHQALTPSDDVNDDFNGRNHATTATISQTIVVERKKIDGVETISAKFITTIETAVEKMVTSLEEKGRFVSEKSILKESLNQVLSVMAESDEDLTKNGFTLKDTNQAVSIAIDNCSNLGLIYKIKNDKRETLSKNELAETKLELAQNLFDEFVKIGLAFIETQTKKKEEVKENKSIEPVVVSVSSSPPKTSRKADIQQENIVKKTFKQISEAEIQDQQSIKKKTEEKRAEDKDVQQEEIKRDVKITMLKQYDIKKIGIKQGFLFARSLAIQIFGIQLFSSLRFTCSTLLKKAFRW